MLVVTLKEVGLTHKPLATVKKMRYHTNWSSTLKIIPTKEDINIVTCMTTLKTNSITRIYAIGLMSATLDMHIILWTILFTYIKRFVEVENNPINQRITDLYEKIEQFQRNNDPRNVEVRNLLEETESLFSEDIRMAPMSPCLKLPYLKYDGIRDPVEHLETYKSWMDLKSSLNVFQG